MLAKEKKNLDNFREGQLEFLGCGGDSGELEMVRETYERKSVCVCGGGEAPIIWPRFRIPRANVTNTSSCVDGWCGANFGQQTC